MSEAAREQEAAPALAYADPLPELLPTVDLAPAGLEEVNDNERASSPREGERIGFEIPSVIWGVMIACYGIFLVALICATSGAHAMFALVVATGYVAMFFGLTRVILRHGPTQPRSVLDRGGVLSTIYGPLSRGEVMAQMLVVPLAIAFFGTAILIISVAVR
jgi:hypothetical protein